MEGSTEPCICEEGEIVRAWCNGEGSALSSRGQGVPTRALIALGGGGIMLMHLYTAVEGWGSQLCTCTVQWWSASAWVGM